MIKSRSNQDEHHIVKKILEYYFLHSSFFSKITKRKMHCADMEESRYGFLKNIQNLRKIKEKLGN